MLTMIFRSTVGIVAIIGFVTAVVLLMIVEWRRIRERELGFVSIFHRVRRIATGGLMIVLLALCFYGWWFMPGTLKEGGAESIRRAEIYLKAVFTLLIMIILSLVWDGITVYQSLNSFFEQMNRLQTHGRFGDGEEVQNTRTPEEMPEESSANSQGGSVNK